MKIVTVIPFKKGLFQEDLTYFTAKNITTGNVVTIPIRNKKVLGLVVGVEDASTTKMNLKGMDFNLKKIIEIKETSIFSKEYLESALKISKYFVTNKSTTVTSLIPNILRENYDEIAQFKNTKARPNMLGLALNKVKNEKLLFQAPLEDRIASYKTQIRASFAEKKSIFIVLPNEHDIKTFHHALSRGIEQFTFMFHGRITPKKILQNTEKVLTALHPVLILGTAPFLSIPRNDIGTIILEHESSNNYKMIGKPHIDLRIFVELFASKINTKLILSDTLLSFETIGRSELNEITLMHPLSFRINFAGEIEILGRNRPQELQTPEEKKFKVITDECVKEIQNAIKKKKSVFVFALRKGLATQTICRDCSETVNCEQCLAPVVLYLSRDAKKRIFSCNRCKRELSSETKCINCGSWDLVPLGIGTDTVYEEIKKLSMIKENGVKIFKLDKESAKNTKEAEKIKKEFEENPGSILVGTEMAMFYVKEKIPLSIIASFDSLWSIPNFKMSEKIIHIIFSIIEKTTDKFIIQTKNENDSVILAVKNYNLLSFVREELEDRKSLHYPPYKRFIKITHMGNKEETTKAREFLTENLKKYNPEIFSGFVAKMQGKYITNALLKIDTEKWSLPELHTGSKIDEYLFNILSTLPPTFEISVDPEDLL